VQGDFFGIQDFVFAAGGETRKHAAKLLRGRSFHVSLFTELAALRILEALGLPSTSQVINAAGKFLIVVPNTPDVLDTLSRIRGEFDAWFLEHTFGQAGLGLAWIPAACQDFLRVQDPTQGFSGLQTKLVRALDVAKHQRFDLAQQAAGVRDADFTHGPCVLNGRLPADGILHPLLGDKKGTCAISRDQLAVGSALVDGFDRLLIVADADAEAVKSGADTRVLEQSLFGYRVAFTRSEAITGKFSAIAADGKLRRCLDFALPDGSDKAGTQTLWNGYARRFISGYVPRLATEDLLESLRERYLNVEDADPLPGDLETFDWLASENRIPRVDEEGKGAGWQGIAALGVIKGDVDDLGEIFRVGMGRPSFAKYAGLSRQLNGFFAIVLPWLLATEYPKVYTVFAGGDDFFLIGPWRTVQKLGARMQVEFARYTSSNAALHFSAGIATQKPGAPVGALADIAEEALASAKQFDGKNAVTCFGVTLGWKDWAAVEGALQRLDELRDEMRLSTGYVYGLLQFLDMHRRELQGEPESAMWRSRLAYRTRRFVVDKLRSPSGKSLDETERQRKFHTLMEDIGNRGIQAHGRRYKIVLFNHLYQRRDR
jgi:CRISPR-associated protein Csm1